MKEFTAILLGDQTPAAFTALMFYALLTAALSLLLQTTKRDVVSDRTPVDFSWLFFFRDNARRIVASLGLIYLALRFAPEIMGVEITPFWACIVGFNSDKLAQLLKDKAVLGKKIEA